jgi:TolA-binding protein
MAIPVRAFIITLSIIMAVPCISAAGDKDAPVITFLTGKVYWADAPGKDFEPAVAGVPFGRNGVIRTGNKSFAEIAIGDDRYTVKENCTVSVSELRKTKASAEPESRAKLLFARVLMDQRTRVTAVRGAENDDQVEWATENSGKNDSSRGKERLCADMAALFASGNHRTVADMYEKNAKNLEGAGECLYAPAGAYLAQCRYGEAAALYARIAKEGKDAEARDDARFYTGYALHNAGEYAASSASLEMYIGKRPQGAYAAQARYLRGMNWLRAGNNAKAAADFKAVMDGFPGDPVAKDAEGEYGRLKQ